MTPDPPAGVSRIVDHRIALAREWDDLVEQVRRIDGFEDFLKPQSLDTLLPAAADGPVVIVNVSRWRCDALLIRADGAEALPLPGLTLETAARRTGEYLEALHRVDRAALELHQARASFAGGDQGFAATHRYTLAQRELLDADRARDDVLEATARWLWDAIAEPVLTRLDIREAPAPGQPWPRLWWCPTGPLTLLPLHAAGHHDDTSTGRSVLDRVVSSYTPTLRALREARRPLPPAGDDEELLIVALPENEGTVPLPAVDAERDSLIARFPGRYRLLEGAAATVDEVREQLPRHRWAHFSCHGTQHLDDPSAGGLALSDGILSVADISARQHEGEFAFLSACMTAVGGLELADEAITLASAMHFTGYRQVIGTLWSIYDRTAASVAEMVYAELTATGRFRPDRSAHALHAAVRHLRDTERAPLHAWTPFTHTGP
jgi:CHAT domain-containing protein